MSRRTCRSVAAEPSGWFDGDPAHLNPALAAELAGGAERLAERAAALARAGRTRRTAHLSEFVAGASPDEKAIQATRAMVLEQCMERETSLMGRALLAVYQPDAKTQSDDWAPLDRRRGQAGLACCLGLDSHLTFSLCSRP
jgi:hypothetical protein